MDAPSGGGGISRVLQGGRVFEKAAVNVSVVYGVMPPEAYRAARPEAAAAAAAGGEKAGPVAFFAAGVSSVSEIPLAAYSIVTNQWRVHNCIFRIVQKFACYRRFRNSVQAASKLSKILTLGKKKEKHVLSSEPSL